MIVVGLTGGVGSGKSTVAGLFREMGAKVIDADSIAREVVEIGEPTLTAIRESFGDEVFEADGALDRRAMAARVFGDDEARARLNAIVHPAVAQRTAELLQEARESGESWVVYDVPLLYENGLEEMFDTIVVVTADEELRRARLRDREGWTEEDIQARMEAQMDLGEKVRRANHVIDNGGTLHETRRQVEDVMTRIFGVDS